MRWSSVDTDGGVLAVEVHAPLYNAAFTVENGELLESVERLADGSWDWDSAGICEPGRDGDPVLQGALRRALLELTRIYGDLTCDTR